MIYKQIFLGNIMFKRASTHLFAQSQMVSSILIQQ